MVWTLVQDGLGHAGENSLQGIRKNHRKLQRKARYNLVKNMQTDLGMRLEDMEGIATDRVRWKALINSALSM